MSMDGSVCIHIVYTKTEMLLTRRKFGSWREIQDVYEAYKASLGPWPPDAVIDYLEREYDGLSPSATVQVESFLAGEAEVCVLTFAAG